MAKSFKKLLDEVAAPKSPEEKAFMDQHTVQKFDYPVKDSDRIFKGTVEKKKRIADNDANTDKAAYDQAAPEKPPFKLPRNVDESVELEEGSYERAAYGKGDAYDRSEAHADAARHHHDEAERLEKARRFDAADLHKAAAKAHDKAEMRMSDIHSKQERGKNISLSSNLSRSRDAHAASVKANSHYDSKNESVEQVNELKKSTLGSFIKKANIRTADAADRVARSGTEYNRKQAKKMRDSGINDFVKNKHRISMAVDKLTGKARVPATEAKEDAPASPDEKSMAMKQAEFIQYVAKEIGEHLDGNKEFPEWMQNKLSALHQSAKDYHSHLGAHGMDESLDESQKAALAKELSKASSASEKGKKAVTLKKAPWDEEVDEASCGTTKKKTYSEITQSATKKMVTTTGPDGKVRTVMKRTKNVQYDDKGQEKMSTKESVQLIDEAVRPGTLRLRSGESVKVSKQDAGLINKMMEDLNASNKRKMEKVMMTDKEGFNEILGFAREAL